MRNYRHCCLKATCNTHTVDINAAGLQVDERWTKGGRKVDESKGNRDTLHVKLLGQRVIQIKTNIKTKSKCKAGMLRDGNAQGNMQHVTATDKATCKTHTINRNAAGLQVDERWTKAKATLTRCMLNS